MSQLMTLIPLISFFYPTNQGNMIDRGSTYFGVNIPGFVLHSAVHSARPDAKCVIHIHHAACIAVKKQNMPHAFDHRVRHKR